jgi:glucose/arabinose dehydrogenase
MKPDGSAEEVVTVVSRLPGVTGHWWRSILVDDDGFYTSVGDPGNLTVVDGTAMADREKIWHFDLEGKNKKLFCTGIRNTEKLLYRPGTKELWGCDHGSDNFGEKYGERPGQVQPITNVNPGDEFNHYVEGGFYGHPFIVENNVPRPEFATREDIVALAAKATPPEWLFHAHWAPNGWTFIHKDYFPGMKGDAVMAFHGSWNSTVKVGYRIEHLMFDPFTQKPCGSQPLVLTLTPDGKNNLARPVDVTEAPDGTLLFSADDTSQIYRISKTQ